MATLTFETDSAIEQLPKVIAGTFSEKDLRRFAVVEASTTSLWERHLCCKCASLFVKHHRTWYGRTETDGRI